MKEIARRIHVRRKGLGISQEELAAKIGVSRQAVSKWESGRGLPDIENIAPLCARLGISRDFLLTGESPPRQKGAQGRLYLALSTAVNFLGLVTGIFVWLSRYTHLSVAAELIFFTAGGFIRRLGKIKGVKPREGLLYRGVNVWILSLLPLSFTYNLLGSVLTGLHGDLRIALRPLPRISYGLWGCAACYGVYFLLCAAVTVYRRKKAKDML